MFQFAVGQALKLHTDQKVVYAADMLDLFSTTRELELERAFDLSVPRATPSDISSVLGALRHSPQVRRSLYRKGASFLAGRSYLTDRNNSGLQDVLKKISTKCYLHGYWQKESFFKVVAAHLRNLFLFNNNLNYANAEAIKNIIDSPSIAVHVRRTDFINSRVHYLQPLEYYITAIRTAREFLPDGKVYVFTDDQRWVSDNLMPAIRAAKMVSHNTGVESYRDMQLMSMCDAIVTCNSTFSWWSGWLNPKPEKFVIAPKRWFVSQRWQDGIELPETWWKI